ncbi:hypothetical protein [Halobaculum lipolyticum]|uniref:Lipoprotein n=1 Tax=Halobaculum lipolyticum TaxID=3032001 RepID=A0ABD5WBJ3_9EURY|nr:hypothetical protein [Halobaculum sp. DT31]
MFRRSLLAAATATLAGCGLAPSPPSTDGFPETFPNAFFAFAWDGDAVAYEVTFERGNRLTADNTGAIAVLVTTDDGERSTLWAGDGPFVGGDGDEPADPRTSFPLSPGARLRLPARRRGDVRVVWTAPDGSRSRVIGAWDRTEQPGTPTGTPEGGA